MDQRLHERMRITALHIAPEAHASYQQNNLAASLVNQLWGVGRHRAWNALPRSTDAAGRRIIARVIDEKLAVRAAALR